MSSFKNGLTKSWFTNSEYERVSTKLHALCLSLLTIIMLFFMANTKEYIDLAGGPKGFKRACLLVANISGMFYASLVPIDVFIRSKYPSFRYFDEFAICAAYACLWSLFALMFKKYVLLSLIGVAVFVFSVGYSGAALSKWRRAPDKRHTENLNSFPIREQHSCSRQCHHHNGTLFCNKCPWRTHHQSLGKECHDYVWCSISCFSSTFSSSFTSAIR